ncbi:MAG: hypothetical protein R3A51_10480 [Nannocystaceae bacterium]
MWAPKPAKASSPDVEHTNASLAVDERAKDTEADASDACSAGDETTEVSSATTPIDKRSHDSRDTEQLLARFTEQIEASARARAAEQDKLLARLAERLEASERAQAKLAAQLRDNEPTSTKGLEAIHELAARLDAIEQGQKRLAEQLDRVESKLDRVLARETTSANAGDRRGVDALTRIQAFLVVIYVLIAARESGRDKPGCLRSLVDSVRSTVGFLPSILEMCDFEESIVTTGCDPPAAA